jgi:hypothetical protein
VFCPDTKKENVGCSYSNQISKNMLIKSALRQKSSFPQIYEMSLSSFETTDKNNELDSLVRKIFEIIDTYQIDWQVQEIKELIQVFVEQQIAEKQKNQPTQ